MGWGLRGACKVVACKALEAAGQRGSLHFPENMLGFVVGGWRGGISSFNSGVFSRQLLLTRLRIHS